LTPELEAGVRTRPITSFARRMHSTVRAAVLALRDASER
jgi:hypothetical protein